MKKIIFMFALMLTAVSANSQTSRGITRGYCGEDVQFVFDGRTLVLNNVSKQGLNVQVDNYDTNHPAPWKKMKLNVHRVVVGPGIIRIGSCAFHGLPNLTDVEIGSNLKEIGWGAFWDCPRLRNISFPSSVRRIETIAFAKCMALSQVKIPSGCRVEDQAFVSCENLQTIELSPTSIIEHLVFATEENNNGKIRHKLYKGEVRNVPSYITPNNSHEYGIAREVVEKIHGSKRFEEINYDLATSDIDSFIPDMGTYRYDTYVLIIGNQNYRFVPNVPYAIHDARIFSTYCEKTLGIPSQNIHVCEDGTKQMIMEEEFEWLSNIENKNTKRLIVYYAGHGVPDINDKNKAYLLPTDVRGTRPNHGVSLNEFYSRLGDLAYAQTTVFLDACFSGINRDNEAVNEGMRSVEIAADDGTLSSGNIVVFAAAQGNETAQAYHEQGHGLFTYYLLKEIRNSWGNINLGELSNKLRDQVSRQALQLKMAKPQTPSTKASESISDYWQESRI